MLMFETILVLLLGATVISSIATRVNIPYPTLLAVGGALVAFVPGAPRMDFPPDLILALFVAPVLLDAAYDASLRDLRDDWKPVTSLVLVAVGLTTIAVAVVARHFLPELHWAAAIALGALLAPPDAVAALAVLGQVNPPHRIRKVLEGESLLNDASALLLYRLAVGAVGAGSFSLAGAVPTFAIVVFGSVAVGWLVAWPVGLLISRIPDAPRSAICQFVVTFGVWLLAERLHLSGVVTIVVFGLTMARRRSRPMSARLRLPSFAIWEAVTMVLNVLAFTLIGLQLRPILENLQGPELYGMLGAALAILAVVILVRLAWVVTHHVIVEWASAVTSASDARGARAPQTPSSLKGGLLIGWSGMRGIVTLAAAMALPADFPYRDFILLTAFVVVLGTLVLQGLTLGPLLRLLKLPKDDTVEAEIKLARQAALRATLAELEHRDTPAAARLRQEYAEALDLTRSGQDPRDREHNELRRDAVVVARRAIETLRRDGAIGDDAYRRVEEELDWMEVSAGSDRT